MSEASPNVICGENNIGKTNLLRAMHLFFNHFDNPDLFVAAEDIPYHIYYGSRGGGAKTEFIGTFEIDGAWVSIKILFKHDGTILYYKNSKESSEKDVKEILTKFRFLLIESHNIDLPKLISEVLEKDGLLPLDTKRSKQSKPLAKLQEFINFSKTAIKDIELSINNYFRELTDFDGILKGKEIKIDFIEFERLRDIVKTMTSISLFDGNNHGIASKGSGAQRAVFLALIQFISNNSKKNIIWGIDEPEAFLQPKLQKRVYSVLKDIVVKKKQPVILTTHSPHFIELSNLKSTLLFAGKITPKKYERRGDIVFYETNTEPLKFKSDFEKTDLIKKHLGIQNNDGWELHPFNILVEGEEDKKYLEKLFSCLKVPSVNIIFSGGASKIAGYLQYYNMFAKDLDYKPKIKCLFDNDDEGREQSSVMSNI